MATIGVPLKVLHEAEGHIVTVETNTGEVRKERGGERDRQILILLYMGLKAPPINTDAALRNGDKTKYNKCI